jgi:hypothetical protein
MRLYALLAASALALTLAGCSCNDDNPNNPDAGEDGGDPGPACVQEGLACGLADVCCGAATCNPAGVCEQQTTPCRGTGEACSDNLDCCLGRCSGGACSAERCVDNGAACSANDECCTSNCSGGTCAAIPGAGSCKVQNQACTSGAECCSTNCQGGFCVAAWSCRANNDLCLKDVDCCSFKCSKNDGSAGYCVTPPGGCIQDGMPCSGGSNCCTRICVDPGTGATVCLPASGCEMTGSACLNDQACCGGGTNPNGSVKCGRDVATDTYGRCDNGQACNPVGNICGAIFTNADGTTFSVNASQNCCDGKKEVCKLDAAGIPRCFGGGSTQCPEGFTGVAPCCIELGEVCQFKDQCCNGAPCVPDSVGTLRCTGSSCVPLGNACTPGTSVCCSGDCLSSGELGYSCRVPTTTDGGTDPDGGTVCKPNGQTCTTPTDCCSNICTGGLCVAEGICQQKDEVCTSSGDCCSGLGCVFPPGATSGTCQDSTCQSSGQSCSPTSACCSGLQCLRTGSNQLCDGTTSCSCNVIFN